MSIQVMTNEKTKLSEKQKQKEENWNQEKGRPKSFRRFSYVTVSINRLCLCKIHTSQYDALFVCSLL